MVLPLDEQPERLTITAFWPSMTTLVRNVEEDESGLSRGMSEHQVTHIVECTFVQ